MLSANLKREVAALLKRQTGIDTNAEWQYLGSGVGGGRWRLICGDRKWFIKVTDDEELAAAEADGLTALAACGAVRIPAVLGMTGTDTGTCLVLEWLDFVPGDGVSARRLGEQLARQHYAVGVQFGWHTANFIGQTRQFNNPGNDWVAFFREQRLGFQLRLAAENGYRGQLQKQGARLLEQLAVYFTGYTPRPALLHGDLWGGNWGVLENGTPVLFDPAVYYGDREADLAMTELFGGFPREFYAAYDAIYPRDSGYRTRRDLYNLYHILNHLNLFGSAYLSQAESMLQGLLKHSD